MTQGPQVQAGTASSLSPMTSGGGGDTSGGGESGGYGDPPAPYISGLSAMGQGQFNGPDQPVGAIVTFAVQSPGGPWQIDPASVNWSGGTDYKAYFSDAATTKVSDDAALRAVSLQTGVSTHAETYTFILGAEQQQYSVEVNCAYLDPNHGEDIPAPPTTVTFNAVRPTTASISGAGGFQSSWFDSKADMEFLAYTSNNQPWIYGRGVGNVISAWTQTSEFGGNFMFLQLVYMHSAWTAASGASVHMSNVGGGENLDNGGEGADLPIGEVLDPPKGGNGWSLAPTSVPTLAETHDAPNQGVSYSAQYTTVNTETFDTYLMYQPTTAQGAIDGVWVALAQLHWSWAKSASNAGDASAPNWPPGSAVMVSGGAPSTPVGAAAFPSWTYDTTELTWEPGL